LIDEDVMRRIEYNKLIRDRIPTIIEAEGKSYRIETMPEDECRQALLTKLIEEVQEVVHAAPDRLVTELADLYEVIDAVLATYGIEREKVRQVQAQRRSARGGFEQRLRLLWVEEPDTP
jgi:predicted house-cleaning noncanonical NTP pyrophosphatase (MazG superfamily)